MLDDFKFEKAALVDKHTLELANAQIELKSLSNDNTTLLEKVKTLSDEIQHLQVCIFNRVI